MAQYFKVVNNDAGAYYSAYITGGFRVTYTAGSWVRPTIGKLFVFKTQQEAEDFIGALPGTLEVWTCEAENTCEPGFVLSQNMVALAGSGHNQYVLDGFKSFWNTAVSGESPFANLRPPVGSLIADAVKIIRKVA